MNQPLDLDRLADAAESGESTRTVVVALATNAVVAAAKTVAAVLSGSASMLAEAAHSWADTGNEVFLLIADKRSSRLRMPAIRWDTGARRTCGRCWPRLACL